MNPNNDIMADLLALDAEVRRFEEIDPNEPINEATVDALLERDMSRFVSMLDVIKTKITDRKVRKAQRMAELQGARDYKNRREMMEQQELSDIEETANILREINNRFKNAVGKLNHANRVALFKTVTETINEALPDMEWQQAFSDIYDNEQSLLLHLRDEYYNFFTEFAANVRDSAPRVIAQTTGLIVGLSVIGAGAVTTSQLSLPTTLLMRLAQVTASVSTTAFGLAIIERSGVDVRQYLEMLGQSAVSSTSTIGRNAMICLGLISEGAFEGSRDAMANTSECPLVNANDIRLVSAETTGAVRSLVNALFQPVLRKIQEYLMEPGLKDFTFSQSVRSAAPTVDSTRTTGSIASQASTEFHSILQGAQDLVGVPHSSAAAAIARPPLQRSLSVSSDVTVGESQGIDAEERPFGLDTDVLPPPVPITRTTTVQETERKDTVKRKRSESFGGKLKQKTRRNKNKKSMKKRGGGRKTKKGKKHCRTMKRYKSRH